MPLRVHVGFEQNAALPDDSRQSASCHVELELDRHLIDRDLKSFQREVDQAFDVCRLAVRKELTRQRQSVRASSNASDAERFSVPGQVNDHSPSFPFRVLRTIP